MTRSFAFVCQAKTPTLYATKSMEIIAKANIIIVIAAAIIGINSQRD